MEELLSAMNTPPCTVLTQVFQLDRYLYSILVPKKNSPKISHLTCQEMEVEM